MGMSIEQATKIYQQYVKFAQTELEQAEKAGKSLDDAKGVANFVAGSDPDGSDCKVERSKTDSIHRWWRGSADRANNVNARAKFFQAVETLLGKKAAAELQGHIRGEINYGADSSRPLSARRIIRISREVDLALMGTTETPLKQTVNDFGTAHLKLLNDFASGNGDLNLNAAVQNLKTAFEGVLRKVDFFNDVKELVKGKLDAFNDIFDEATRPSDDKATALKTMLEKFNQTVVGLRREIEGRNLPDSRERSALYGTLVTLELLNGKVQTDRHLLDVPRLRTLMGEAKAALQEIKNQGKVPAKWLPQGVDQLTEEGLMRGKLTGDAITSLKQKADNLTLLGQTLTEIENKKAKLLQPGQEAIDALVGETLGADNADKKAIEDLQGKVDKIVSFNNTAMLAVDEKKEGILPPYQNFVDKFASAALKAGKLDEHAAEELKNKTLRLVEFNAPVEILQKGGEAVPVSFRAFVEAQTLAKLEAGDLSDEALESLKTLAGKLVNFSQAMTALEKARGALRKGVVVESVDEDLTHKADVKFAEKLDDEAIEGLKKKAELLEGIATAGSGLKGLIRESEREYAKYFFDLADRALAAGNVDKATLDDLKEKEGKFSAFVSALCRWNACCKSVKIKLGYGKYLDIPKEYVEANTNPLFNAKPDEILKLRIDEIEALQTEVENLREKYLNDYKSVGENAKTRVDASIKRVQDGVESKLRVGLTDELKKMLFLPEADANPVGAVAPRQSRSASKKRNHGSDSPVKEQPNGRPMQDDTFRVKYCEQCKNDALQGLNRGQPPRMLAQAIVEEKYAQKCSEHAKSAINAKLSGLRNDLKNLAERMEREAARQFLGLDSKIRDQQKLVGGLKQQLSAASQKKASMSSFFFKDEKSPQANEDTGKLEQQLRDAETALKKLEEEQRQVKERQKLLSTEGNAGWEGCPMFAEVFRALAADEKTLNENISLVGDADLASLGNAWLAIEGKYGSLVKSDPAELLKQGALQLGGGDIGVELVMKPLFNLDDRAALVHHELRRRQADFKAIVERAEEMPQNVRAELLKRIGDWFDERGELPKALVEMGVGRCALARNETEAKRIVRKFFNNYFACVAEQAVKNQQVQFGENGLPATEQEVVEFIAGIQHVENNDLTLSAFGHAGKIDHALKLLDTLKRQYPMAADLEQQLQRAKILFSCPPEARNYDSDTYGDIYRGLFKARLDEKDATLGDISRREYLTDLLEDLEDVQSTADGETRAMVLGNCKKFAELALSLASGLAKKAYDDTLLTMDGKQRALVGVFPKGKGKDPSLNTKRLQELFKDRMGLDEEGWTALTEQDVKDMLPHLQFVLTKGNSHQYAAFLKGVGEKELPQSLLKTKESTQLLHDLVYMKVNDNLNAHVEGCDPDFEVGLGTVSGKEILCGLAMDSLQDLPYVGLGDSKGRPPTMKVLSLLWAMNGKKFGGLPELCRRTFGVEISKLTVKDCKDACDKMHANLEAGKGTPLLAGYDPLLAVKQNNGAAKSVMNMLGGDRMSAFTSWNKRPDFKTVKGWIDGLRALADGRVKSVDLKMNNVPVRLSVTSTGYTTAEFQDPKTNAFAQSKPLVMWIGQTPGALAASLADTALRAPEGTYGGKDLQSLLPPPNDPAARDMALTVLTSRTHTYAYKTGFFAWSNDSVRIRTADLSDVSTAELLEMAGKALRGDGKNKDSGDLVAELNQKLAAAAPNSVNSQGVLDVLARLDTAEKLSKSEVDARVRMPPPAATPSVTPAEAARQRAHGFVADLLSCAESWKTDNLAASARIRLAVTAHAAEIGELLKAGDENAIKAKLATLGSDHLAAAAAKLLAGLKEKLNGKEPVAANLGVAFDAWNGTVAGGASGLLTEAAKLDMEGLQAIFIKEVEEAIVSTGTAPVGMQSLHELVGTASVNKTDKGYGEFLTNVLKRYFTGMGDFDKLRMLANVVRNTHAEMDAMDRMAVLVKGAGPIFLKLVQGIPEGAIPKDKEKLRKLLGDVKDRLPPMSDRVIKAQLYDMVARSNGKIIGIDVVKSLGAASVGQALLCRVRTASNPDGDECVIKLLRPDAQNAVRREMAFFKGEMAKVPGMDKTFQSRLDTIVDELDLAKEAINVETGLGAYRGGSERVSTMELHSVIRPTETSLVVKKARGVTCDKYFRRVGELMNEILANLRREDKVEMPDGGVRTVTRYRAFNLTECNAQRDKLYKLYCQTLRRQRDLVALIGKWAEQAVFGTGFFHGDLHAGNIMMDETGVTLIDYGNAVQQTDADRKWLIKLLTLSSYGNADDFVNSLKNIPKASADALRKDLKAAFAKGTMNDSGLRVATAVNLLQRHGVPVPPNLYNFTQSMLRLQETLNLANETLAEIKSVFLNVGVDAKTPEELEREDPLDLGTHDFLSLIEQDNFKTKSKPLCEKFTQIVYEHAGLSEGKRNPGKKTLLDKLNELCSTRESVRDRLLPLLEKHAMFHEVDPEKDTVPDSRDDLGMKAYVSAKEMLDESFDFDSKVDRENRIKTIHNLIVKRARCAASDVILLERHMKTSELKTFSEVLCNCINGHVDDVSSVMGIGYLGDVRKIEDAGYEAAAEVAAQKWVGSINRKFLEQSPAFSPTIVFKISNLVREEFAYEEGVFAPKWYTKAESKTAMAEMLLANVRRLKQLLVREEGYKPEEDKGGVYLRQALTLAFAHYAHLHSSPDHDMLGIVASADRTKHFDPWMDGFATGASFGGGIQKPDQEERELLKFVCNLLHDNNAGSDKLKFLPTSKESAEFLDKWIDEH